MSYTYPKIGFTAHFSSSIFTADGHQESYQFNASSNNFGPVYDALIVLNPDRNYSIIFDLPTPSVNYYASSVSNTHHTLSYMVDYEYNYYSDEYETITMDLMSELGQYGDSVLYKRTYNRHLPDLHWFLVYHEYVPTEYEWAIPFNPPLAIQTIQALQNFKDSVASYGTDYNIGMLNSKEYFVSWAKDYKQAIFDNFGPPGQAMAYRDSAIYRRWGYHNDVFENLMNDTQNKRESYPMFAKISFDTHAGEEFVSEIISDYNYENALFDTFRNNGTWKTSGKSVYRNRVIGTTKGELPYPPFSTSDMDDAFHNMTSDPTKIHANSQIVRDSNNNITSYTPLGFPLHAVNGDDGRYNYMYFENFINTMISNFQNTQQSTQQGAPLSSQSQCNTFMQIINAQQMQNQINTFLQSKNGTGYTEVIAYRIDKKLAEQPDRGFEGGTADVDDPVLKSWFYLNRPGTREIKLFDTQVIYDTEYTYTCYAYVIVQASTNSNTFKYTGNLFSANTGNIVYNEVIMAGSGEIPILQSPFNSAQVLIESLNDKLEIWANGVAAEEPPWIVIEVPMFRENLNIIDSPPVKPDVNMVGYRGVSDKILMMFSSPIDQIYERPKVIIESEDKDKFLKQINAQQAWGDNLSENPTFTLSENYGNYNAIDPMTGFPILYSMSDVDAATALHLIQQQVSDPDLANTILFETDDPPAYVEIFRIQFHPSSYTDFANGKRTFVPCFIENTGPNSFTNPIQHHYSTSYEDEITPNTVYYYCFRTVDIHGNISNPTSVYKLEMYKDGETIYPIWGVVEFIPKVKFDKHKTFQKYIKISPAVEHKQFSKDELSSVQSATDFDVNNAPTLGTKAATLWDKTMVVRVTSTQTGKSVDVKVKFTNNGIVTETE